MPYIEITAAKREEVTPREPLVVGFYGERFTCSDEVNQWSLMELAASPADGELAIMSALMRFLASMFVPEDWQRFRDHCRANNVGLVEIQPLVEAIVEQMVARPTPSPSDSPDGSLPTTANTRVVSFSPDIVRPSA